MGETNYSGVSGLQDGSRLVVVWLIMRVVLLRHAQMRLPSRHAQMRLPVVVSFGVKMAVTSAEFYQVPGWMQYVMAVHLHVVSSALQ